MIVDIINGALRVDTIYLISAVGTGKTDIAVSASIFVTLKTYWTVFRKNVLCEAIGHSIVPDNADRKNFKEGELHITMAKISEWFT